MHDRRWLVIAAAIGALIASGGGTALGAEGPADGREGEVRAAIEEVLADPRYQRTRPDGSLPTFEPPPIEDFELPDLDASDFAPSAASGVSEALLWVLLGVFALAVVLVLGREGVRFARERRRRKRPKVVEGDGGGLDVAGIALERLPASLARARQLAAEGRFEEAVHVLLEGALGYLHALASFTLEPAFTSREVLAQAPLTSETRRAFGDLVMTVEISLFGGLPVGAADFSRCEESFVTMHRRLGAGVGDE